MLKMQQKIFFQLFFVHVFYAAPSGPPTSVMAMSTSPQSISFMWSPPLRNQLNGILRYYFIVLVSEAGTITRNVSSVQLSTSISGLIPYSQYNCTLQAETVALGPASGIIVVYTPQDGQFCSRSLIFANHS